MEKVTGYVILGGGITKEFEFTVDSFERSTSSTHYYGKINGAIVCRYPLECTVIENIEVIVNPSVNEKELSNKIVHNIQDLKNRVGR